MLESQARRCTAFEGTRCIGSGELPQVVLKAKAAVDRGERAPILIFDDGSGQLVDVDLRGNAADVLARLEQLAGTDQAPSNGATRDALDPKDKQAQSTPAAFGPGGPDTKNEASAPAGKEAPPALAGNLESPVHEGNKAPAPAAKEPQRGPGRPKLGVVGREVTLLPRHWDWLNRQSGGASVALRKLVDEARRVHQGRDRVRQSQEAAYRFMSAMAGNEAGFEEAIRALFAGDRDRFERMVDSWPVDLRDHAMRLAAAAFTAD